MRRWLEIMLHPDGEISFFNDASMGISPAPELIMVMLSVLVFHLSIKDETIHLEESGYIGLTAKHDSFLDVAQVGPDYLPAHAHADTLSFEMSLFGNGEFLSTPGRHATGKERSVDRKEPQPITRLN